jgi:hypothetical protein
MKTKAIIIALCIILLCGCTSETKFGKCVGIADDKDPSLVYKTNAWNIFMGVVFFEAIIPPIIVLADETSCPVAKK